MDVDVAIFGGGPAGSAAALRLASHGFAAAIIERRDQIRTPVGETLPPDIRRPLRELGLWPDFLAQRPVPSYEIRTLWGAPELQTRDYCCDPHGPAWHIDRGAFDRLLIDVSQQCGIATHRCRRIERLERTRNGWTIGCRGAVPLLQARFLVDATGRQAAIARRLGARRHRHDRQIALIAFAAGEAPARKAPQSHDNATLIEAAPQGWWYSAVLPNWRTVVAFITDSDLMPPGFTAREAAFREGLRKTRVVGRRGAAQTLGAEIRIVDASTSRLEGEAGEDWLAAGDSNTAHDPLCGAGIFFALTGGIAVADAIARALHGERYAIAMHRDADRGAFARYLQRRARYYALERRWPRSPYWERRLAA